MNAENDRPCAVLKQEHQVILRVLDALEGLISSPPDDAPLAVEPLTDCIEFFRLYADACHHAKEEDLLFPVLEARGVPKDGGPIGVMLEEHRIARGLVAQMAEELERFGHSPEAASSAFRATARDYLSLLRQHIFKEDHVLFEMGDRVMSEGDQEELAESFCTASCREFGGKRREELEALADSIESQQGQASA